MPKKIAVKELLKKFEFQIVNKGKPSNRYITSSGIARIGIELATPIKPAYKKQTNPVCFGTSELNYFKQASPIALRKIMRRVKKLNPPIIILNSAFKTEDIKRILKALGKTDITVASVNMSSTDIYFELSPWIARKIAPSSIVHGTLMSIYGIGVLITGDSGTGKSEAAMELLKAGRMFVGDDAIEVYNYGHAVYGHPSNIAKQFIEVRGLGILDVSRMFGWQSTLPETQIHMTVHLVNPELGKKSLNDFERLGVNQETEKIRGVKLPKYYIPVTAGRPTASLIESAVVDFKMKRAGYNSAENYLENYDKVLTRGGR
ncbi:MAG: HPr(Ser) kinase/phosphatase [Mycoplasma sp.]|nr:HPr(Ser) kinase/phosphatase [Candidatus Hennigella equi]